MQSIDELARVTFHEARLVRMRACILLHYPSVIVALSLSAVGCREEGGATVRGRISYKNQPVAEGTISFIAKGLPSASGRIQPDGSYSLVNATKSDRIEPGRYAAVIIAGANQSLAMDGPARPTVNIPVPVSVTDQATTPLSFEVKLGENVIDVDLDDLPAKQ